MVHVIKKVSHGGTRVCKDGETRNFCIIDRKPLWFSEDEKTINQLVLSKTLSKGKDKWSFNFWMGIICGFPLEDIFFYCDAWSQNLSLKFPEWSRNISELDREYAYILNPMAIERIMRHKNYKSE